VLEAEDVLALIALLLDGEAETELLPEPAVTEPLLGAV
jgi:hypothetical protein